MIKFDQNSKIFHLDTANTSYVFGVYKADFLLHLYWGKKIGFTDCWEDYFPLISKSLSPVDAGLEGYSTNVARMEYPTHGSTDTRTPAFECTFDDGTAVPQLRYKNHKIFDGKQKLCGLPASYAESDDKIQSLEVTLTDNLKNLDVILCYSVFEDYDVITRSVRVENRGNKVKLNSVISASVDIPEGQRFDFLHLDGCWARERHPARTPIFCGTQVVDMKNGASGHYHNPFVCFPQHSANEQNGNVYGMNLVYSGEFLGGAQMDSYGTLRTFIGINKFGFGYTLEKGEVFQAPEAVLVYSDEGIGKMSRIYHKFYRERLCRGKFRDIERYALINNWEATYFDFTEEKLLAIAEKAKEIGLDLLVLDDGWFGKRNNDRCALGDWYVNREKLPLGLNGLANKINALGLKFGLWFEPEMVSPDSDLYRAHPDWALHIEGRQNSLGRSQLTLDLSRKDVCDYIIDSVCSVLESANIEYVKWDMNRYMSEVGSALLPADKQCEVKYRYMLGLYRVLEEITSRFPNVLFESCASGGGRFDPGMLYYMPQTWTSDDTDAIERLFIQHGTSICYPYSTMGAHVSVCPNHQVGRTTPFKMRGDVATPGQFGYELDLAKMSDSDIALAGEQVKRYKKIGHIFHKGDLYRLESPFDGNFAAIQFISEDKRQVAVCRYVLRTQPSGVYKYLKLQGLEPNTIYTEKATGKKYKGDFLMNVGIPWVFKNDYESDIILFEI